MRFSDRDFNAESVRFNSRSPRTYINESDPEGVELVRPLPGEASPSFFSP